MAAVDRLQDHILTVELPLFCDDPSRNWGRQGFHTDWRHITEMDAADFLRAIDGGLLNHVGRGLYRAPRSYSSEQFFWSGPRVVTPRPITLWMEPIITVATIARLHLDLGWPMALLGTQSKDGAFDAAAYRLVDAEREFIACEVKKTTSELDHLVRLMRAYSAAPRVLSNLKGKERNAYRKLNALKVRQASFFWAVGPAGANQAFRMSYQGDVATFEPVPTSALHFAKVR